MLNSLPHAQAAALTGRSCLVAAAASWLCGGKYHSSDAPEAVAR